MGHLFALLMLCAASLSLSAQSVRERILLDDGWQFAFGNAASPQKDFGCGTEYFNYLTKAASIHNEGPYSLKFDASKWGVEWKSVDLPHDWAVDLPYAAEASHSHGYKTVGYKYPETGVGWYRKTITIPEEDLGKHLYLQFDGIFRDARVWINGFYLGHEPSGYATQTYDITEYLNYGGENLITVRADATLEEGWFYEGAGIYRHVWLNKTAPLHVAPFGTFVHSKLSPAFDKAVLTIETTVENSGIEAGTYRLCHVLQDAEGKEVARCETDGGQVLPKERNLSIGKMELDDPALWSVDTPYLYTLQTEVYQNGRQVDAFVTAIGIREVRFDADKGFFLNGEPLKLKGVNMHQDHPGVGTGLPDALQVYRLRQLKALGCNAYRSSHNPMTPEMLDACDRMGILVIEENRLTGVNEEHIRLLRRMIERDRNHPCIILWSVGNEEWGIEWEESGTRIAASMREYCHRFDPTRPMTVASSSGPSILIPADVAGYNYILQHPVEQHRKDYPQRRALGSEETTGCGTRGIYFDAHDRGHMMAHNRRPNGPDSLLNCIERGWKFYDERPYLAGLFYWTGFDYRGEPNPMKFPATGSQFGLLDYCGFPKDEAYYLKSWWTDEPVLHILPHWNLHGHEGDSIDVWVYSNCDEVELAVNGKSLGRKPMEKNGYLAWKTVYRPGAVKAVGYKNGRKMLTEKVETADAANRISITADRTVTRADKRDVAVIRVELQDKKKRFVPTACDELAITVAGPVRILGVGNGDPAYQDAERPMDASARTFQVKAFNGLAQILLQSTGEAGEAVLTVGAEHIPAASFVLKVQE
ncbi:beta-galactosidase [Bacteroides heparinolyticus]|uniref:Beta-galactosidase n=1 Tax=Prevotella heparinolytica TaxID=28113 RepID=A0A4R2LW49_9BACE|nr:beta-galactosidase GalA [Bacteroides heparinolyticus]TCO91235.1 beta-galactosidase [Bacteroides heparinolyticus]